jgi:tetratricopeptide (TPR) repeat protein
VQTAVRSSSVTNVSSATANWQRAERFFRAALAADPNLTEARVRLGRVIGLLGRHQEAVAELQRAAPGAGQPLVRYYLEMFLGAEEQALGLRASARSHYEQAARLCPTAQSPYLALSQIGENDGDRAAALGAIQQAFDVTADQEHRADPWWNYLVAPFADATDLVARCRSEFSAEKRQ